MNNRSLVVGVIACALAVASAVHAQDLDLSRGDADLVLRGSEPNANAGVWMDRGPVNGGDGRRDLVMGAPGAAGLLGHVYVINGGPVRSGDLTLAVSDTIVTGVETGDLFGYSGALGNILNTEGTNPRNLVVGAPLGRGGRGVVYLFAANTGARTRTSAANAVLTIVGGPGDQLGSAIATADLDHDTYREIIIGAPGTGRIYIIRGGPALSGTRNLETQPADYMFGGPGFGSVLAAGDVTGDGLYDLVVGAPSVNAVHLYRGQASGQLLPTFPSATFTYVSAIDDRVGASVELADINADGIRDIIIGAPLSDGPGNSRMNAGSVFVLWGSSASDALASRDLSLADVTFYGDSPNRQFGTFVTSGGVNRDSPDDLVILAAGGGGGAGDLIIYYGRAKNRFGIDVGGRRIVDTADPTNVDRRILGPGTPAAGIIRTAEVFEETGEGAGEIIAGVPNVNGNTGAIFVTVSPKFAVNTRSVTVRANGNVVIPSTIEVQNPSLIGATWSVSSNRPWIALSPTTGSSSRLAPSSFVINVNASGLSLGTYTGTVTLRSTSKHLDMLISISVTLLRVPLDPPGFLTAAPAVGNGVMLQWGAVAGAAAYMIQRIDLNGTSVVIANGVTATSFFLPNAAATNARYTITSVNSAGQSGPSMSVWIPWGVGGSRTPTVMMPRDYDGDGKADVAIFRVATGQWFANRSSNNSLLSVAWGAPSLLDHPVPADYDGDGKADVAVYRETSGEWFILRSSDGRLTHLTWGAPSLGDLPVPADYDGDGKADIAIYRGTTGEWFVLKSSNQTLMRVQWGAPSLNDLPLPADYDGDHKADIAVYRGTTGEWFVQRSSDKTLQHVQWGAPSLGDVPIPADFDGDGKADIAVYRGSSGDWFALKSSDVALLHVQWGAPALGDVPVCADYDGDGKADVAIYRSSSGEWYIYRSSDTGLGHVTWGAALFGDTVRAF